MREEAAAEVMKSCQIYRLYGDDTEGLVLDAKEVPDHAAKGGIFGVEKSEWKRCWNGRILSRPLRCPSRMTTA